MIRNRKRMWWVMLLAVLLAVLPAAAQKAKPRPKAKGKVVYKGKAAYRGKTSARYRGRTVPRRPVHPVAAVPVSNPSVVRSAAAFSFANRWHDFGDVVQGEKVIHTFAFRNTGKDPLIISTVQPTCGCTVTEWPRNPILPGQSGEITVTFDSKSSLNQQARTVTVISNAVVGRETLYLRGNVLPRR